MVSGRAALLIATWLYDDPTFRRLRAPSADVDGFQEVLANPAIGGYDVQLLSNAPSHQINQAIEGFFARNRAKLDDLVLLYFSGHGLKDDAGRLYMVTHDSRRHLLGSTAVSAQFVHEQLDRCRSRRKIVLLDCCYAGAFPVDTVKGSDSVDVLAKLAGRGSAVITASSALEYAFESAGSSSFEEIDEVAAPSVFTGALIEGLATGKADLNGDGLVDVNELYDYIYNKVREAVPQQTPGRRDNIEGTLYIATSPRGIQPKPLPEEVRQALHSPLTSSRLGVIDDLITLCSGTHPGMLMVAREALSLLTTDDSKRVAIAARSACEQVNERTGKQVFHKTSEAAGPRAPSALYAPNQDLSDGTAAPVVAAEQEADSIRTAARREADELILTAEREVAKLRATANHEIAEKQAAVERDIAKLRTRTEREVAQLKASAKRQRDEILTTSKRQADEMRSQAQRIVSEAEQRASTAEQRGAKASAQAEQTRRDADEHAKELVSNAKKNADQIASQAKSQADHLLAEMKSEAERARAQAQRQVDDLTRQKDTISSHLAQLRQLLGGGVPGMEESLEAKNGKYAKHAVDRRDGPS